MEDCKDHLNFIQEVECPNCKTVTFISIPITFKVETSGSYPEKYQKLLEFVKSVHNHFSLSESEIDFMKFYVKKEHEASQLLQEIGELE